MRLLRLEQLCEQGSGSTNEDATGFNDFGAWVLDGATGLSGRTLTPHASDPYWYTQWWNRFLTDHLNDELDLASFCARGIDQVAGEYHQHYPHATPLDYPSAAASIVRFSGDHLEYQIFGDAVLILRDEGKVHTFRDTRLCQLDNLVLRKMNHLINRSGLNHHAAKQEVMPLLRQNRQRKNTVEGYWTLEFESHAASQCLQGAYKPKGDVEALLLTDGLSCLMDTFEHCDATDLLDLAATNGLAPLYQQVRTLEAQDPDLSRFTRFKPSDDASAVYFQATN